MLYHKFDLSEYFTKTHYNFLFYDALFKLENQDKESILKELNIPPSSYRKCRSVEQKKAYEIMEILNNYFKVNYLDVTKLDKYEIDLSRIITKLNYQTDDLLTVELNNLEIYIKDNNILEPIFKLFYLLIKITNNKLSLKTIKEETEEIYARVKMFKNFFDDELKAVFYMIQSFYEPLNKMNYHEIHLILDKTPYAKGMFYYLSASKYFIEKEYHKALSYAERAERIYVSEYNRKRLVSIKSNICCLHNLMENYALACDTASECASSVFAYYRGTATYQNFKLQYFLALYMMGKVDSISDIVAFQDKKDDIDYLFMGIINPSNSGLILNECENDSVNKEYLTYKILLEFNKYINGDIKNAEFLKFIETIRNDAIKKLVLTLIK